MSRKRTGKSAPPAPPPENEADDPNAEEILERLLRAASTRADALLRAARKPKFTQAYELQALLYAVNAVNDSDYRWMQKFDPEAFQERLAARAGQAVGERPS